MEWNFDYCPTCHQDMMFCDEDVLMCMDCGTIVKNGEVHA